MSRAAKGENEDCKNINCTNVLMPAEASGSQSTCNGHITRLKQPKLETIFSKLSGRFYCLGNEAPSGRADQGLK